MAIAKPRLPVVASPRAYISEVTGRALSAVDTSPLTRGEVDAGGRHVATYAHGTTTFAHTDWPCTERARTSVSGAVGETCSNRSGTSLL